MLVDIDMSGGRFRNIQSWATVQIPEVQFIDAELRIFWFHINGIADLGNGIQIVFASSSPLADGFR
jgi:hypothetical protein